MRIIVSPWWEAEVPDDWNLERTRDFALFSSPPSLGTSVKIDCLRKPYADAFDSDLNAWAKKVRSNQSKEEETTIGILQGFVIHLPPEEDGTVVDKWYLKTGAFIFLISCSFQMERKKNALERVVNIISSIKLLI